MSQGFMSFENLTDYHENLKENILNPLSRKLDKLSNTVSALLNGAGSGENSDLVPGSGGLIEYSTEEKMIGIWIDGKPLYEKTLFIKPAGIYNNDSYNIGVNDIDTIFIQSAFFNDKGKVRSLPLIERGKSTYYYTDLYVDTTGVLHFSTGDYWSSDSNRSLCFVVRYTKTTD